MEFHGLGRLWCQEAPDECEYPATNPFGTIICLTLSDIARGHRDSRACPRHRRVRLATSPPSSSHPPKTMNPNKTYQTNRRSQLAVILGLFAAGASPAGVVTLQPVDDAYLSSSGSEADQTFNGAVLDQFGYYSAYKRPLLKFDLSSIPDGATIVSARLTLGLQGIYGGQGHSTTLWRMPNDNWNETTVTWNTYTQAGAVAVASLPGTNDLGARVWDIPF